MVAGTTTRLLAATVHRTEAISSGSSSGKEDEEILFEKRIAKLLEEGRLRRVG
ncbi:MAG: hypothetical protein NTV33_13620 [Coprothermobacterota bacterium]|jgi:hypothetical protein|nr:hypothetical protein [Coprothermobacterota bacterium]